MSTSLQSCGTEDHLSCTTVTTTLHLTDEFLRDVLTTAIEGGVTYWSRVTEYQWDNPNPNQVYAVLVDIAEYNDHEPEEHRITLATVVTGIERILARPQLRQGLAAHIFALDAGEIDADDADVIVQMGLFNEVTYG